MTDHVQLPDTFVVHGVAERDANELVCQFFNNEDDARAFMLDLPGRYEVERLSGINYDALVIHHHASAAIGFVAPAHHKAEPYPRATMFGPTCLHCGLDIKSVPGGQGSTWVHTATGAVAGSGAPR